MDKFITIKDKENNLWTVSAKELVLKETETAYTIFITRLSRTLSPVLGIPNEFDIKVDKEEFYRIMRLLGKEEK